MGPELAGPFFWWGPILTCCIYTIRLLCCRAICNKSYSISILMLFAHETLRPEGPTNTFSGPTKIAPSSCKSDIHFHTLFTPPPTLTPPIVSLQELPALFQRFPSSDFHFHTLFTNSHPPIAWLQQLPALAIPALSII